MYKNLALLALSLHIRYIYFTIDLKVLRDRRASGYGRFDRSFGMSWRNYVLSRRTIANNVRSAWERLINHLQSIASKSRELVLGSGLFRLRAAANTLGWPITPVRSVGAAAASLSLRNDLVFLIALSRNTSARCCINEALLRLALPLRTVVHEERCNYQTKLFYLLFVNEPRNRGP